jgi:hypothetical protein
MTGAGAWAAQGDAACRRRRAQARNLPCPRPPPRSRCPRPTATDPRTPHRFPRHARAVDHLTRPLRPRHVRPPVTPVPALPYAHARRSALACSPTRTRLSCNALGTVCVDGIDGKGRAWTRGRWGCQLRGQRRLWAQRMRTRVRPCIPLALSSVPVKGSPLGKAA